MFNVSRTLNQEFTRKNIFDSEGSKVCPSMRLSLLFRRRILKSKLTTPFWSRSATIEIVRVMLYSTWMICWLETETLVL